MMRSTSYDLDQGDRMPIRRAPDGRYHRAAGSPLVLVAARPVTLVVDDATGLIQSPVNTLIRRGWLDVA